MTISRRFQSFLSSFWKIGASVVGECSGGEDDFSLTLHLAMKPLAFEVIQSLLYLSRCGEKYILRATHFSYNIDECRWRARYKTLFYISKGERMRNSRLFLSLLLFVSIVGTQNISVALSQTPNLTGSATAKLAAPEKIELQTSDGVQLAVWYYPVPEGTKPIATIILLHGLEGSHETVETLALFLQKNECAVVSPDLRGHGESTDWTGGKKLSARDLKARDLLAIAASSGGRVREQATVQGDIEAVRNWIKEKSDSKELDLDKLIIVGSGTGATLGAIWTANDWLWPPLAARVQGRHVKGIVLISPVFATKGLNISPALLSEAIKTSLPLSVIGGISDKDTNNVIEKLKKNRPKEWYEMRAGEEPKQAPGLDTPEHATIFCMQVNSSLIGDKLLTDPAAQFSDWILAFVRNVLRKKN